MAPTPQEKEAIRVFTESLIEKYRNYPCLYSKQSPEYANKIVKDRALESIAQELGGGVTAVLVKKAFNKLRKSYGAQLRLQEQKTRSGAGASADVKWPYFKMLGFLRDNLRGKTGSTTSNMKADSASDSDEDDESVSQDSETSNTSFRQTMSYREAMQSDPEPIVKFPISPSKLKFDVPHVVPKATSQVFRQYTMKTIAGKTYLVPLNVDKEVEGEGSSCKPDQCLPVSQAAAGKESFPLIEKQRAATTPSALRAGSSGDNNTVPTVPSSAAVDKRNPQGGSPFKASTSFQGLSQKTQEWFSSSLLDEIPPSPPSEPVKKVNKQASGTETKRKRSLEIPDELNSGIEIMSQAADKISKVMVEKANRAQVTNKSKCLDFLSDEIEKMSKKKKARVIMEVTNLVMTAVISDGSD